MINEPDTAAARLRIETALMRAARSRVIPDYSSFQAFMMPILAVEHEAGKLMIPSSSGPYTVASMMLLMGYQKRLSKSRPSPMDFRRYKLLLSLSGNLSRSVQVAQAFSHGTLPHDPTLDTDQVTPAVLRMRLIVAIERGAYEDAQFLLGRLDEADHDLGERAYLQALACFASGRLSRTIMFTRTVTSDAVDRPRAAWLAAKAAALTADPVALEPLLTEISDRLTPCGWLHLLELYPPSSSGRELPAFSDKIPSTLVIVTSDPAYGEWALRHTQMMGRVIAREREIIQASLATSAVINKEEVASDPIIQRNIAACRIEQMVGGTGHARDLAKRLHPAIATGDMRALRVVIEMLLDASDFSAVVALAKRFFSSSRLPWHHDLDIVGALYTAAIPIDERWSRRLQRLLAPDQIELANRTARRTAIANHLIPMARISFLAAAKELDRIRKAEDIWRDCGLIALGLFRALEIEFNARLARPLAARLDVARLRAQLPEGERKVRAQLRALEGVSTLGEKLMLGQLAGLLAAMSTLGNEELATSSVRAQLRVGFLALLSPEVEQAVAANQLSKMIDSSATGRFRNPPAHGEFLRLEDAGAALVHVEDALDTLTAWLPFAC